jgi:hypothetical protein
MKRQTIAIAAGIVALAVTGTVLVARAGPGGTVESVGAGTAKATNNVAACSAIGGGGGLCDISLSGDYFDQGILGNGKYSGQLVIDWSTYASGPNNEMCASVSGTMTYTTGSSVLKTNVVGASDFSKSYICETPIVSPPYAYNRDYNFFETVVSGTGKFKHIVPSSSNVFTNGEQWGELNSAQTAPTGKYLDSPTIASTLIFS